ncbi:hypothetical protein [Waddlia chondrophila]|uniref:Secreted protein n=1 Tax=Waddlia chondrophila (strain ATCC VR-1470 / WSU 86-1044) TaxID=716544 RepID=D6YVP4_WADCW|nr:hypothetical protein [Waddlia chondrophila]ADI38205.1 hypothetical protein wcw_0839 [Waddlia chondrophila WSU 86-1044]
MKKWLVFFCVCVLSLLSASEKSDYFAKLTPQEAKDIQYIVTTLGNTSAIGLLFKKKSLEQAGARIDDVHPLRFFGYVMTNPQLKASFDKIKGVAWSRFKEGMAGSLEKADSRDHLNAEVIDDFSSESHLDRSKVQAYVDRKQWEALIDFMRR